MLIWRQQPDSCFESICTTNFSQCSLFATAQQPHSADVITAQKILPPAKLIKLQKGTLANKVNNGLYLLSNFSQIDMMMSITNNEMVET